MVFINHEPGGVAARMRQAIDNASADRIGDCRKHDRQSAVDTLQRCHSQGAAGQDDVWGERNQIRSVFYGLVGVVLAPACVDPYIPANTPAQFLEALVERCKSVLTFRVLRSPVHEHADAPYPLRLLGLRGNRPHRPATDQRDELAPSHVLLSTVASQLTTPL
jgi:hypothetical protein